MPSNLLQRLRSSSTADEVINLLQEIIDLDDDATYRVEETAELFRDATSPLRVFIESNKTNDALIGAVGSFFLWFMPQPEEFPVEFQRGQEMCIRDTRISVLFIDTLLPNAQSTASIYSVCRSLCRIIYGTSQPHLYFISPKAVQEITNVILRASEDLSCHWSVTIIGNICANIPEPREAFATPEVVEAILRVFTLDVTATTIQWAFAALFNLQFADGGGLRIFRSDSSYALRMILNGMPQVATTDGMQWACSTLANIIDVAWAKKHDSFVTHFQTKEVARILFSARKYCGGSPNAVDSWTKTINGLLCFNTKSSAPREVIRMFAEMEDDILGSEMAERLALRKCKSRADLLRVIRSDEFIASFNNTFIQSRSLIRVFNNTSVLIEKIEYFLQFPETAEDNDDDEGEKEEAKHQFICDVISWFDANFFVASDSNRIVIDSEQFFDFFLHTVLGNSSFRLPQPRQITTTVIVLTPVQIQPRTKSSAEMVLALLNRTIGNQFGGDADSDATKQHQGQSWIAAVEQVLGLIEDAAEMGEENDEDLRRQAFVVRLSLGLSLIPKLCSNLDDKKALFLVDSDRISNFLVRQTEIAFRLGFCLSHEAHKFVEFVEAIISVNVVFKIKEERQSFFEDLLMR